MQQMSSLLTATDLASVLGAANSSLGCDVGHVSKQACNSTVNELQFAILQASLALGLLNLEMLNQLLPAEAWGVTLQPNCSNSSVQLVLPEPVVRLNGSPPTVASFHPTLDGGAVHGAATLVGPLARPGGSVVYVLDLGPESGGKLLSLSVEEETLVAPLRGLMPKMILSTPLADCLAPSIVSLTASPDSSDCPWLGGLMASALMAALSLLELSWRMLPKKGRIWRRGNSISPEPTPAIDLPRERLSPSPPASPPLAPPLVYTRTRVTFEDVAQTGAKSTRALFSFAEAVVGDKPKLSAVVWIASVVGSAFLLALGSFRQFKSAQTVAPLPVWFVQSVVLSSQCGNRQSGLALLPALRTLGVSAMSIAVAIVTAIPSATDDLGPSRRLMIVGPTALIAALFIAFDAEINRRPFCSAFKEHEAWGSLALLVAVVATVVGVPPFDMGNGSFSWTLVSTLTALLLPLSLGLLWRVRRTSVVSGDRQRAGLHVSLAPWHAVRRRAYNRGTAGKELPNAPAKLPTAAKIRLRSATRLVRIVQRKARARATEEVEAEAEAKQKAATEGVLAIEAKVAKVYKACVVSRVQSE